MHLARTAMLIFAAVCMTAARGAATRTERVSEFTGEAVQRAIDTLAEKGGGKVVVPAGKYPFTSLRLRSGIELHLEKGAVLSGPTDPKKCAKFPKEKGITLANMGLGLIQAWNEKDISITGEGAIDANGAAYFDTSAATQWGRFFHPYAGGRPEMLQLCRCKNVVLRGVSFLNSPSWTMRVRFCENLDFDDIKVLNDLRFINADGIDFDACRHVRLRRSKFLTGDDSIVLRAIPEPESDEPSILEDMLVEDCDLESACQTIRVGLSSDDTVRNVTFRNIRAKGNNGIFFEYPSRYLAATDEGYMNVHDIAFEGFAGEFRGSAIWVLVESGIKLRGVRDILFKDLDVKSAKPLFFKGNVFTKPERLKRINFRLDGKLLPDGEFAVDCTDNRPLKRAKKGPEYVKRTKPAEKGKQK